MPDPSVHKHMERKDLLDFWRSGRRESVMAARLKNLTQSLQKGQAPKFGSGQGPIEDVRYNREKLRV